jgi:hypothetical protein
MRIRPAIAVFVASLSVSTAVYAAPANNQGPTQVVFAQGKTVKFSLRNDAGSLLELKVGDQVLALGAGKTVALKLPVGTRILVNASTPRHQAGELLAEASVNLDATTVAIR